MKISKIYQGDCLEVLRTLPDNSVDSVVTDPPYGIGFMGKAWDTFKPRHIEKQVAYRKEQVKGTKLGKKGTIGSAAAQAGLYDLSPKGVRQYQSWCEEWARECLRVLKPGGHLLASNSPRMYHRMTSGIEDGGFEIRDTIAWCYGSGFPKSHNLHGDWEGWGSALKPAFEPIVVARKPFKGTLKNNVETHGTGGLNIDGCRVETDEDNRRPSAGGENGLTGSSTFKIRERKVEDQVRQSGRWPANLIHDGSEEVLECFPNTKSGAMNSIAKGNQYNTYGKMYERRVTNEASEGSAARFFYCAKASKKDRDEGLEGFEEKNNMRVNAPRESEEEKLSTMTKNFHPTVKPTALMRYLVKLVTPPGGTVLDPFTGSGSTGKACKLEGMEFIGIEREEEYVKIARSRIENTKLPPQPLL